MHFSNSALITRRACILADLHFGCGKDVLGIKGWKVEVNSVIEKIRKILDNHNIKKIVVAGDVKHTITKFPAYEKAAVELFLKSISDLGVDCIVVKGNHDPYLAEIIEVYDTVRIGRIQILHGHKRVDIKRDLLVLGHAHPKDIHTGEDCFILGKYKDRRVIILPAFSIFAGRRNFEKIRRGYIFRKMEIEMIVGRNGELIWKK